jgi:hypothetical protein
LRRRKTASAASEDVVAEVRSLFVQEATGNVAGLRPTTSGIARAVTTYRELASVTNNGGED